VLKPILGKGFHDSEGAGTPQAPADAGALEAEADRIRARVEEALGPAPVEIDELIRQLGAPASVVVTVLLEFELAGRVARDAGNRVGWA
jgi:DNA processing protein